MGRFWLVAKAAMMQINQLRRGADNLVDQFGREVGAASGKGLGVRDGAHDFICRFHHVAVFFLISLRNGEQHALESGPAVMLFGRKISPTIKRLAVRSEE